MVNMVYAYVDACIIGLNREMLEKKLTKLFQIVCYKACEAMNMYIVYNWIYFLFHPC